MDLRAFLDGISDEAAGVPAAEVAGVTSDSRQVREGYVFVAIPGERYDGREFIHDAEARGALCCVVGGPEPYSNGLHIPVVTVPDVRLAVARLASRFHGNPSARLRVVGTTGTNGKTTVSCLVRDIFKAAGLAPGLVGTIAYEIGERTIPASRTTPEAPELQGLLAQMVAKGCRSAIMEVSSHALDQKRVAGIDFDVAAFTNLTGDHLDYHRDMERYFAAKASLFRQLDESPKATHAVINMDDPFGRRLVETKRCASTMVTYGTHRAASVRVESMELSATGSRFTLSSAWGRCEVETPLMGRFNVSNVLAALSIAVVSGVKLELAADAVRKTSGAPGRLEEIPNDAGFHVFVDYAHTDDALSNVLHTLREVTSGKLIVVFGCGGDRDKTKRPLMGRVAEVGADVMIVTSDNPRTEDPGTIIEQIVAGVHNRNSVKVEVDRRAAIQTAIDLAEPGDMVLVAGKGHEHFQEVGSRTIPFDDRQVVREALEHEREPARP